MDPAQQQQAAMTSGQISSMQQQGVGGGDPGEEFTSIFDLFVNGMGKAQNLSLQNVGLGKMFSSGPVEAGLHLPGGKSAGKLLSGTTQDLEFGEQQAPEGMIGSNAQPAGGENYDNGAMMGGGQGDQPYGYGDQQPPHGYGDQQPTPYGYGDQQMPHGYGQYQQMPHGYGEQAMGMGGGRQEDPFGYGGQPQGYGQDNENDMFAQGGAAESQGERKDPFASSGNAVSGRYEGVLDRQYTHNYRPGQSTAGGNGPGGSDGADSGDDADDSSDSERGRKHPFENTTSLQVGAPKVESVQQGEQPQHGVSARGHSKEKGKSEGVSR